MPATSHRRCSSADDSGRTPGIVVPSWTAAYRELRRRGLSATRPATASTSHGQETCMPLAPQPGDVTTTSCSPPGLRPSPGRWLSFESSRVSEGRYDGGLEQIHVIFETAPRGPTTACRATSGRTSVVAPPRASTSTVCSTGTRTGGAGSATVNPRSDAQPSDRNLSKDRAGALGATTVRGLLRLRDPVAAEAQPLRRPVPWSTRWQLTSTSASSSALCVSTCCWLQH